MPHQPRLDAPDALHHVKGRGLNERLHFRPRLPWEGCHAYRPFVSAVDQGRVALPLEWSGYTRFDPGLWILGHVIDQETIDIPTWPDDDSHIIRIRVCRQVTVLPRSEVGWPDGPRMETDGAGSRRIRPKWCRAQTVST